MFRCCSGDPEGTAEAGQVWSGKGEFWGRAQYSGQVFPLFLSVQQLQVGLKSWSATVGQLNEQWS